MALVAALAAIFVILAVVLLNVVAAFLVVCDACSPRVLFIYFLYVYSSAGLKPMELMTMHKNALT